MAFMNGAEFASPRGLAVPSATSRVTTVQPAPRMQQLAKRQGCDRWLNRISAGIGENAANTQRLDLERLGRGAELECRFQETLAHLKDQIAWKAARTRPVGADGGTALAYKAS